MVTTHTRYKRLKKPLSKISECRNQALGDYANIFVYIPDTDWVSSRVCQSKRVSTLPWLFSNFCRQKHDFLSRRHARESAAHGRKVETYAGLFPGEPPLLMTWDMIGGDPWPFSSLWPDLLWNTSCCLLPKRGFLGREEGLDGNQIQIRSSVYGGRARL